MSCRDTLFKEGKITPVSEGGQIGFILKPEVIAMTAISDKSNSLAERFWKMAFEATFYDWLVDSEREKYEYEVIITKKRKQ